MRKEPSQMILTDSESLDFSPFFLNFFVILS